MKTREQALETIKVLVLALRDQAEEMSNNPDLVLRWQEKATEVKLQLEKFDNDDQAWFEKAYRTWCEQALGIDIRKIMLTFG